MAWEWYQRLPAGVGRELESLPAMRRHHRRAFLLGAVHVGRNQHAVPMHEFRRIGVVDDLHRDRLALAHAQHRARCSAVVADRGENVGAVELDRDRGDAQRVVGLGSWRSWRLPGGPAWPEPSGHAAPTPACANAMPPSFRRLRLFTVCPSAGSTASSHAKIAGTSYPRQAKTARWGRRSESCPGRRLQPTPGSLRLTGKRFTAFGFSCAHSPSRRSTP